MITIQYSCNDCGLVDRPVQVPARVGASEDDVVYWVKEIVALCVADDHQMVSPKCKAAKITQLKIPIPKGTEFIGQQIE